jgi:hypothetical protein
VRGLAVMFIDNVCKSCNMLLICDFKPSTSFFSKSCSSIAGEEADVVFRKGIGFTAGVLVGCEAILIVGVIIGSAARLVAGLVAGTASIALGFPNVIARGPVAQGAISFGRIS